MFVHCYGRKGEMYAVMCEVTMRRWSKEALFTRRVVHSSTVTTWMKAAPLASRTAITADPGCCWLASFSLQYQQLNNDTANSPSYRTSIQLHDTSFFQQRYKRSYFNIETNHIRLPTFRVTAGDELNVTCFKLSPPLYSNAMVQNIQLSWADWCEYWLQFIDTFSQRQSLLSRQQGPRPPCRAGGGELSAIDPWRSIATCSRATSTCLDTHGCTQSDTYTTTAELRSNDRTILGNQRRAAPQVTSLSSSDAM